MHLRFNERYEIVTEELIVSNGRIICGYLPCYGLIKINDNVIKILDNTMGYLNLENEGRNVIVKYFLENIYTDGYYGDEITEKEMCNRLIRDNYE